MSEYEKDSEDLYREACRIVGECCLMLASNDAETNRDQLVHELKRFHCEIIKRQAILNVISSRARESHNSPPIVTVYAYSIIDRRYRSIAFVVLHFRPFRIH